jgi:hypothetical protein
MIAITGMLNSNPTTNRTRNSILVSPSAAEKTTGRRTGAAAILATIFARICGSGVLTEREVRPDYQ